jgi:hypothetical protein
MEAQVPSHKPDFAKIVLGCKGLTARKHPKTFLVTKGNFFFLVTKDIKI